MDPKFDVFEGRAVTVSAVDEVTSIIEPNYFAKTFPGTTTFTVEVSLFCFAFFFFKYFF